MDEDVRAQYESQVDIGARCQAWLNLETTQEFLQPLKNKLSSLKEISYEDILSFDDKSFRSKVEAAFLAAKEIEDYFAELKGRVDSMDEAQRMLKGKTSDEY